LFLLKRPLWLASGSRYRRELLARLGYPFEWRSPDLDESRLPGETPAALALRLARGKALAVARALAAEQARSSAPRAGALVIGSDQVCALGDECLGKPGSPQAQAAQLARLAGHRVVFHTAVCIVGLDDGFEAQHLDETTCEFRALTREEIAAYVAAEPATDCAGGFKCEGLGITLLERLRSEDPTALVGLPLIWVARTLRPWTREDVEHAG
jgi:septum formation protein